ncbi:hypothetical protein GJ496_007772 [Pomphorhynchus laevis]|nr:hypothetical protein GJ496_007772 [Pomphorhynchus laevis]
MCARYSALQSLEQSQCAFDQLEFLRLNCIKTTIQKKRHKTEDQQSLITDIYINAPFASLLDAFYPTRITGRTYQVSDKPNWLRQLQRQLINFCNLLYCQILSDFRKTSMRKADGLLLYKAEKAPWLLTRRNCSNKARIPISNWAQHLSEVLC